MSSKSRVRVVRLHAIVALYILASSTAAQCLPQPEGVFFNADGGVLDNLGWTVAISGDVAVAGAPGRDDAATDAGAVFVYRRTSGVWALEAVLHASDAASGAQFGAGVDVSGDVIAVGAPRADGRGTDSGKVYVFRRVGASWLQEAAVLAASTTQYDYFGDDVAIDGDTMIVGAYADDPQGTSSGSAAVFRRIGGVWTEESPIISDDGQLAESFGFDVDLDGNTALVGAPSADAYGDGTYGGSAYVFRRAGTTWTQESELRPSDHAEFDNFGHAVSIHGDLAIVGNSGHDHAGIAVGAAYIYRFDGTDWFEEVELLPSAPTPYDAFGLAVAIEGDTALVGAFGVHPGDIPLGVVYIYRHNGSAWLEDTVMRAPDADAMRFEWSLDFQGETAVIGGRAENQLGVAHGRVYMMSLGCDCPPDLNDDGVLDFFDVQVFLAAFASGQTLADLTGDGAFDFFDVLRYLQLFADGCG